jgi:hypothetical protein
MRGRKLRQHRTVIGREFHIVRFDLDSASAGESTPLGPASIPSLGLIGTVAESSAMTASSTCGGTIVKVPGAGKTRHCLNVCVCAEWSVRNR